MDMTEYKAMEENKRLLEQSLTREKESNELIKKLQEEKLSTL